MLQKKLGHQVLILIGLVMIWSQIIAIVVFAILMLKKIYHPFDLLSFYKFLPLSLIGSLLLFLANWQILKTKKNKLKLLIISFLIAIFVLVLGQVLCQTFSHQGQIKLISSCLISYLSALFALGISSIFLFKTSTN